MASFINFLQVNQHIAKLTTYGGIAPLAQSKWYIGVADQDPKAQPIDVYIKDTDGNKQILKQPIETDAIGNFIDSTDANKTPLLPQIDKSQYSLLIEVLVNNETVTYEWKSITSQIDDDEKYQQIANLIDIENLKPSDDTKHNAPTAKSTIDQISKSINGILRVSDLSDAIDSDKVEIPANSKAVNDLRIKIETDIQANTKSITSNTKSITTNTESAKTNTESAKTNTDNILNLTKQIELLYPKTSFEDNVTITKTQEMEDLNINGFYIKLYYRLKENLADNWLKVQWSNSDFISIMVYMNGLMNKEVVCGSSFGSKIVGFNISANNPMNTPMEGVFEGYFTFSKDLVIGDSKIIEFKPAKSALIAAHSIQYLKVTPITS